MKLPARCGVRRRPQGSMYGTHALLVRVRPQASIRDMVTPAQRRALTKEGYKIIGTHSAVKLCRWTKHHLRGRGGCYKHTCYGITSYQCMETTPSLACANKCVFCWRHHKNPIGRKWRWKTDAPEVIVEQAIAKHQAMIKEMRGVPGVRMDRWNAAFTVRASRSGGGRVQNCNLAPVVGVWFALAGEALCPVTCGRANHVPTHQRVAGHAP